MNEFLTATHIQTAEMLFLHGSGQEVYISMYLKHDLWHGWWLQQNRMWSRNRQGVTDWLWMCVFLVSSLTVWGWMKSTQIKAVYFLLREEKALPHSVLLCCPPPYLSLSLPSSWMPGWWMAQRGEEEEEEHEEHEDEEGGLVAQLCSENPSVSVPWARLWRTRLGFVSVFINHRWCAGFSRWEDNWSQRCLCFRAQ